ncbi:hypothetical protein FRB97_007960 [Tulasnella sp. 331]|nr:hypothetical protein FRB97_007960 [Tulasnella sp. 331]
MSTSSQQDNRVAGGYKATISNPNTSEEAKTHAREMLAEMNAEHQGEYTETMGREDEIHSNRVIGGYKATLNNPNVSQEAKDRAEAVLGEQGYEVSYVKETDSHTNRVLGGYKATLSNPNTSEEAKMHAAAVLDGEEPPSKGAGTQEEQYLHRVIGGYKATLSNPNTSDEAKEQARLKLKEHGVEEY